MKDDSDVEKTPPVKSASTDTKKSTPPGKSASDSRKSTPPASTGSTKSTPPGSGTKSTPPGSGTAKSTPPGSGTAKSTPPGSGTKRSATPPFAAVFGSRRTTSDAIDADSKNSSEVTLTDEHVTYQSADSIEAGPSTDAQGREVKWGPPGVAVNEIAVDTAQPRRTNERWFNSTAFKSGLAMLAVVGVIGVIVGVAATQSKDDVKNARSDVGGGSMYHARHMSLECDTDPPHPGLSCISDDWNSLERTEGTRVFYRCESLPAKVIVRIVECDGFSWIDKFNKVENCHCGNK